SLGRSMWDRSPVKSPPGSGASSEENPQLEENTLSRLRPLLGCDSTKLAGNFRLHGPGKAVEQQTVYCPGSIELVCRLETLSHQLPGHEQTEVRRQSKY